MTQRYRNNVSAQYNKLRSAMQCIEQLQYYAGLDIARHTYHCDYYDETSYIIDNLSEANRNIDAAMDCLREIIGDYKVCKTKLR